MKQKEHTKGKKLLRLLITVIIMAVISGIGVFIIHLYNSIQAKSEYRDLGIIDYANGNYVHAVVNFQASLKEKTFFTEPLDRDTRLYLADSYFLLNQYQEAIEQYDILLETEEEQIAYLNLQKQMAQGLIDFQNGDFEAALPAFQAAIDAGHTECTLYAGVCAVELGKEAESVAYLTTYLSYNPDSAYACTQLADYYLRQGLYDTCYQYLQQGLQSTDRSCDEELLYVEIVYYEYKHEFNRAYELTKAYMETFPVTEKIQKEYDFLYTRQTIEE